MLASVPAHAEAIAWPQYRSTVGSLCLQQPDGFGCGHDLPRPVAGLQRGAVTPPTARRMLWPTLALLFLNQPVLDQPMCVPMKT
jgi:hypothetical protein